MSENGISRTGVGRKQIEALETLHARFARDAAAGLAAMLRDKVDVRLAGVEELTYGEFIVRLENPTCFNVIAAEPLEGKLALEIHPAILHPVIDRLLGGGHQRSPMARRPLTEIELRLVSRVTDVLLGQLRAAWKEVLELNPRVERVENNPQLAELAPRSERVVLIRFDVALGKARGRANLAIPSTAVEQIRAKLSAGGEAGGDPTQGRAEGLEDLSRRLRSAVVGLEVCLAQARITTGELIGLQVGDVITTEQDAGSPILVSVEGVPKFRAVAGAHNGRKAIHIEEVLDKSP